jgi:hypothetical protein
MERDARYTLGRVVMTVFKLPGGRGAWRVEADYGAYVNSYTVDGDQYRTLDEVKSLVERLAMH